MKIMNKKLLLIAGVAVTSASIYSSTLIAATVSGDASANVITPLGVTQSAGMNFGDVAGDTGGTSVVLSTAGTTSGSGVVAGGTTAAGAFAVTGEVSTAYTLTLPASITIDDGGINTMLVNAFTTTLTAGPPNTFTSTLDASGDDNFTVGATLTIGATQAAGTYSGTYAVIVSYD